MNSTALNETQVENKRGEWVPSIPLPYYEMKKRCECGRRFWTMDGYRGHYAYAHILGMEEVNPKAGRS